MPGNGGAKVKSWPSTGDLPLASTEYSTDQHDLPFPLTAHKAWINPSYYHSTVSISFSNIAHIYADTNKS